MKDLVRLKELTSNLTVLYVEDEELFRMTISKKLNGFFKSFLIACDGFEGLDVFRQNDIALIITDNIMPNMNGLDMIEEIRKKDTKTPVILVTGYMDTEFLIRAINLGVTQFVAKPINYDTLYNAIEIATQRVILENLQRKTQEQELELLKYREKYHSLQQERAFRKELNIIRNDLYMRKIVLDCPQDNDLLEWHCSNVFIPLDIMSGDSYLIREIGDKRYLFTLIDAMGKGLSASVTAILSTSYINHLATKFKEIGEFSLRECIDSYYNFIQTELLDDEIVCLSFIYIDFDKLMMEYALFSMPPLLMQDENGEIHLVKSNNPPIMKFPIPIVIGQQDISKFTKMLFYTDGLNECFSKKNELYGDYLKNDFANSHSAKELFQQFAIVMDSFTDDITIIFLDRLSSSSSITRQFLVPSKIKEITTTVDEINLFLESYLKPDELPVFMCALSELVYNAYEHGSIDLESDKKKSLISNDLYDAYLREHEEDIKRNINIKIIITNYADYIIVNAIITDEGKGFDVNLLLDSGKDNTQLSGRGVRIAENIVDGIYYNNIGNEVTLKKKLKRGG
ncbi:MAG: response regulator [Thermodesulfovibrionales bacterium]|nr:response regulator [Thermodesulfovibrionales bacterium]